VAFDYALLYCEYPQPPIDKVELVIQSRVFQATVDNGTLVMITGEIKVKRCLQDSHSICLTTD